MNRVVAIIGSKGSKLLRLAAVFALPLCSLAAPAQQRTPTEAAESVLQAQVTAVDEDRSERKRASETVIEQRRQGNRIAEIVVKPAGTTYSYTLRNREGRTPLSRQDLSAGLSTPSFIKFDF